MNYLLQKLELPKDLIQVERNGYEFQMSKDPFCRFRYKGKKKSVVGYRYSLGMHMIAGHGHIDTLEKIRVGEKVAWSESSVLKEPISDYPPRSSLSVSSEYVWFAQTFTASSNYTLSHVQLRLWKWYDHYLPGIITVSIRVTDGSGHPIGEDLCAGTTDGDTLPNHTQDPEWRDFEFNTPVILTSGVKYAIVVRLSADKDGFFQWSMNDNYIEDVYPGGNAEYSTDAGNSWIVYPSGDIDFLFKTYTKDGSAPNQTIIIDNNNLFGGDRKEGGVSGDVDLMFGDITQSQNDYLKARLDNDIPAFRGFFSAVLNQVYIGTSPYLKPWSFFLKRACKQISGDEQWYKEKAIIRPREEAGDDLNAVHIIRECLIDSEWGLGWSTNDFNDAVWKDAADILYDEGFGLSMLWDQVVPIEDFIDDILSCIAGMLYQDLETGKWILTLTREPTDANILQASYTDDDTQWGSIYGVKWAAQSFLTSDYGDFDISSVSLKLIRTGGVGNDPLVTISIRATDGKTPIGGDLCSGTIAGRNITQVAGGDWYNISLGSGATLEPNTRYAIVMRVPTGTDPSSIDWRIKGTYWDLGHYNDGLFFYSSDEGLNWGPQNYDAVFKVYSNGTLNDAETFDESDIISLDEFTRPSYGEIVNQVVVNFWDKLKHKSRIAEARDIALIEKQGGALIEKIFNFQGICNTTLANQVAERELKLASSMLAGMRLKCTRKMAHLKPNDIFKFSWPDLDITQMILRVLNVNYGNLNKNEVYFTCVEDEFSSAETIYGDAPDSLWTDPVSDPVDIVNRRLIEIPYYSLCNHVIGSLSLVAALDDDTGFICTIAGKPTDDSFDYDILARLSASYSFDDIGAGNNSFTPTGVLTNDLVMNAEDVTIDLSSVSDLDLVEVDTYAIIGEEIVKILSVDTDNNQINIARGILDTVPATHSSGDLIYFMGLNFGEIETEYTNGDTPSAKLLSRTANGSLAEADATVETADALDSRMIRPYLPGNLKFNGISYPGFLSPGVVVNTIQISWNHRDRTAANQLHSLVKHTAGDVGTKETDVTYTIKVYDVNAPGDFPGSPVRTVENETGTSWNYTEDFENADFGSLQDQLRFVICAVRVGYDSFQSYDIIVSRMRGSAAGISNADSSLSVVTQVAGFVVGTSTVSGFANHQLLTGLVNGISGVDGSLSVATELQGSADGISNVLAEDFESPPSSP